MSVEPSQRLDPDLQDNINVAATALRHRNLSFAVAFGGGHDDQYGLHTAADAITLSLRNEASRQRSSTATSQADLNGSSATAKTRFVWITDPYRRTYDNAGSLVVTDLRQHLETADVAFAGQSRRRASLTLLFLQRHGELIVKPIDGSEGRDVILVDQLDQPTAAVDLVHRHGSDALVEAMVRGTELAVPVVAIPGRAPVVFPMVEVTAASGPVIDEAVKNTKGALVLCLPV